jgi:hypothetical protein
MSTRPAARTSSLGSVHPAAPPAPATTITSSAATTGEAAGERRRGRRDGAAQITFYIGADQAARSRAAFMRTQGPEGNRTWSDFIADAVRRETERLERTYNDAQPWPGVQAGAMPTGRPVTP